MQVIEIFEIWIGHIFEFFWLPKVASNIRRRLTDHDVDVSEGIKTILVYKKDKALINRSDKYGCVIVCYLVSGEIEEVEVELCREIPLLEETGSRSGNHCGATILPLPQEEIISEIASQIQYNALYDRLLVALKATKTLAGDYIKANPTPLPLVYSCKFDWYGSQRKVDSFVLFILPNKSFLQNWN